jgi:hypothetical protein
VKFDLRHLLLQAAAAVPAEEKMALRPPHPEIPPTFWEQYHSWILLGSFVGLGIILLLVWLIRRPKPVTVVPIEVRTRNELEALRAQPETGATISAISRSLRNYFTIVFDFPVEELTTAELNRLLTASQSIGPKLSTQVVDFFKCCDQLKFAPASEVSSGTAQRALELLELAERRRAELRAAAQPPAA